MGGWRGQRNENYDQGVTRTRSQNRRPPLGSWQPTVPSWEKKFCIVVGAVPWRKVIDTKKIIHLYENVLKWNDSAGEEAFHNAKTRYWEAINGLPCDISLPDPDIYIDKIDWNSEIDPELILDLDRDSVVPDGQEKGEQVVILGDSLIPNQLFSSTGWGDAEWDLKQPTNLLLEKKGNPWEPNCAQANAAPGENGWGDVCDDSQCRNLSDGAMKNSGWTDNWNNSQGWNQYGNNYDRSDNLKYGRDTSVWQQWAPSTRNGRNTGVYMSRYKTSRFPHDDHLTNPGWRNGRGRKRVNFAHEPVMYQE